MAIMMLMVILADISELPEEVKQIVSEAVPAYNTLLTTSKLNVIQSVISAILVDEVFGVYFFGLPDERVSQIQTMEEYLSTIGEDSRRVVCILRVYQWPKVLWELVRAAFEHRLMWRKHHIPRAN